HRLTVDDPGTGGRLPPGQAPDLGPQGGVDLLPDPVVPPGVEVRGNGLPGREVVRQHPPGAAAPGQVQGGVDDLPQRVGAGPARFARALGEQVLEVGPLEIGQVTGIALPCNGIHAKKVTLTTGPAEDYFLDGQLGSPRGGQTAAVLFSVTSTCQRL